MNKTILILTLILLFSCKKKNLQSENQVTINKSHIENIPELDSEFQSFIAQFPKLEFPIKINGCEEQFIALPKLNLKLSLKFSPEAEYEHIYGIIPSNGKYISTITLGMADCMIPILTTYEMSGKRIDSKAINIGYCGFDPCYECVESMTIKKDFRIYVADTIKTSECDEDYKAIAGTEKIKVIFKTGLLSQNGKIELNEIVEKQIK